MKVSATTLPRKSASATGLPSCEVSVKGGAGPITGSRLSPPVSCAIDNAGNANIANAKTTAMPLTLLPGLDPGIRGSLPLPASGERVGVRGTFSLIRVGLATPSARARPR